jgi:hypothetical protein
MKNEKCENCQFYKFSKVIGNNTPIWHCQCGFSPSKYCIVTAEYNRKIENQYIRT